MGHASRLWQLWIKAPDPRSEREIQGDIDDELAFHIEERTRELSATGLATEAARTRALERFGNIDKVRAECRRVQLGDRIMLHRSILVTLVVLLAGVVALGFQNVVSQRAANAEMDALRREISSLAHAVTEQRAPEDFRERLGMLPQLLSNAAVAPAAPKLTEEETSGEVWVQRLRIAAEKDRAEPEAELLTVEVARLRDRSSFARVSKLLPEIWPQVPVEARRALLEAMARGSRESLARSAIRLAVTDADAELSRRALELLREITFVDLANAEAYRQWEYETIGRPAMLLLRESVPAVMQQLLATPAWTDASERWGMLESHERLESADMLEELLRQNGAARLIQAWASDPSPRARIAAVRWLRLAKIDEVTGQVILRPIMGHQAWMLYEPQLLIEVCRTIRELDYYSWATQELIKLLFGRLSPELGVEYPIDPITEALSEASPKETVRSLISFLGRFGSKRADDAILQALASMTGESPDHDKVWWDSWWSIHRGDY